MCTGSRTAPAPELRTPVSEGDSRGGPVAVEEAVDAGRSVTLAETGDDPGEKLIEVPLGSECPDGFWALIPNYAPASADEVEMREFERRRETLASRLEELRATTFYSEVGAELGEYDLARHRFPVTIDGMGHCRQPDVGRIRIAYSRPRVVTQRDVGEGSGAGFRSREWEADEFTVQMPIPDSEAQALRDATRGLFAAGVRAEVVFRVRRGRVDRQMWRDPTGERTDIGAGPLVEVERLGFRILRGADLLYDSMQAAEPARPPRPRTEVPCSDRCERAKRRCAERCRRLPDSTATHERMACHSACESTWTECVETCLGAE